MMYICDKAKTCSQAQTCGGAEPHHFCAECGNCPMDITATCIEFNECFCMDEEDDCENCRGGNYGSGYKRE